MATKYWIKAYIEILDDPKMGRLPCNLWRRFMECCLLAGEEREDGYLPDLPTMAWRLRVDERPLDQELRGLAETGLLSLREYTPFETRWFVSNFAKRQEAMPKAEYMRRLRETAPLPTVTEPVTISNIDIDKIKDIDTDTDKIAEKDSSASAPPVAIPKVSPVKLEPETVKAVYLFKKWNEDRNGRGYGNAKKFGTIEQKKQVESALENMSEEEIEKAIKWALLNERTDRTALCNAIVKWAGNLQTPKPEYKNGYHPKIENPAEKKHQETSRLSMFRMVVGKTKHGQPRGVLFTYVLDHCEMAEQSLHI